MPAVAKGNIFRLPQTQAKILRQPENSFAPLDWRRVCGFATHHLFSMAKLCVAACAAHPTYLPKCMRKITQPETQWSGDGSSPNGAFNWAGRVAKMLASRQRSIGCRFGKDFSLNQTQAKTLR